jgi:hypothetical protein
MIELLHFPEDPIALVGTIDVHARPLQKELGLFSFDDKIRENGKKNTHDI